MNEYTDTAVMRRAMANAGLSVYALAKKAGISTQTAYRAAKGNGKITNETLKAIGDVLGVEPASLMK